MTAVELDQPHPHLTEHQGDSLGDQLRQAALVARGNGHDAYAVAFAALADEVDPQADEGTDATPGGGTPQE